MRAREKTDCSLGRPSRLPDASSADIKKSYIHRPSTYACIRAYFILGMLMYCFDFIGYIERELLPCSWLKKTYYVATLSYNNYYVNLRDYSNSLISGLLQRYSKYPYVL
jgi:hypothetical protein